MGAIEVSRVDVTVALEVEVAVLLVIMSMADAVGLATREGNVFILSGPLMVYFLLVVGITFEFNSL